MMAFGFMEILMLALMSGGINSADLVDLVQPTHYFQYRQWEPSVDKMADLASEDPKDAKGQIAQLTCLRYLVEETAALKKSPRYAEHRKALEAIAQGNKAQDSLGFAKEFANRVLLKLDNKKPEAAKLRPVREHALDWFPANATLAGAIDRQYSGQAGAGNDPLKDLLKLITEREKKQMYEFMEKSGNIRIERAAFAWVEGTGKRDGKIFARFTGKGNQDWMVAAFDMLDGGRGRMQIKVTKDAKGTRITLMEPQNGPVIMLVGNTDLLVVGYEGHNRQQDDLVTEVLDARSKKKPSATTGPLKDRLAKIPDKAVALLVGDVPDEMKREFARVFDLMPTKVTAFIERAQQGLDVQIETPTANAEDAGKLVRKIGELRKEGIKGLKDEMQEPQRQRTPPIPFQALINLLETAQVQSKDENAQIRAFVPDGLIQQMPLLFGWAVGPRDVELPQKIKN
jgi:hypothetical protein